MNRLIQFFIILLIAGCTFSKTKDEKNIDIFDKILLVKKSRDLTDLETYLGKPQTIELSIGDTAFDDYYFQKTKEHPSLNVFVNRTTKKYIVSRLITGSISMHMFI